MAKDLTIGKYGHEILGNLYAFGALTRPWIMELTGLNEPAMDRQLRHLRNGGLVARARDVASWKDEEGAARTGYYLTPAGVEVAAFWLGLENDYLFRRGYKRIRLPGTIAHRLLANEYLLAVRRKAAKAGVEFGEVFCEACPWFPLFGRGSPKTDRENSPYRFARTVPDATYTISGTTCLLEVETGTVDRRELVSKMTAYAGRWRRLLAPNTGEKKYHDRDARLEPVVILTPETKAADRLQNYLRERLPEAEEWAEAAEAIRAASTEEGKSKATPGMLVIVAAFEEVKANPLGRVYRPLRPYPKSLSDPSPDGEPGGRVSLSDAAEISRKIPVPEKPPEPTLAPKKPPEEKPLGEEENVA